MADGRGRRAAAAAVLTVLAVLALAGCSDGPEQDPPDFSGQDVALWNPCDALDAGFVKRVFGSVAKEEDGTAARPECRFAPDEKTGQPAVEVNYLLFPGGLDEAWQTMGQPHDADVSKPTIARADAARVVVDVVKKQLYVTGFVQNGDLIQSVNVVDPAPYDRARVVDGVSAVLTALSRHADEAGVASSEAPTAGGSHGG